MAPWRTLLIGVLLLVFSPASADSPQRVLILQSFGRGFEPFTMFSSAFRTELAERSLQPIEFHEISLEAVLFGEAQGEAAFIEFLTSLDAQPRIDLVVAIGGPAIRFVQRNRERVFSTTRLLIAGVDERLVSAASLTELDASVPIRNDLRGAVENILTLLPDTRSVVVVLGRSPLEQFWVEQMRTELEPFEGRLELSFFDELSLGEILERVAVLPPHTAIFYGLLVVDADGVPYEQERALTKLRAVASAPIFGLFEHQLGRGIVGGPLLSVELAGREAAGAARRILSGEPPSAFRLKPILPGPPEFDQRELARFGIDDLRLPSASTIRFRTPSFWALYRWQVLGLAAVCLAQALLVSLLLLNRGRRRRVEDELRNSREQYALALEGSSDGIWDWNVQTDEVFLSPRCYEILGLEDAGAVRRLAEWDELVHPGDRARVAATLRGHLAGRTPAFRAEYRLRGTSDERWLLVRGKAQRDTEGRANRMVGSLTDVTERRLAEKAVREVSRRLILVQEEERARLARELHDDVTQRLARLAIDAGTLEQSGAARSVGATMRDVREGLVRLSEDIHALSYRLHPSLLEDLGLPEALQVECDRFSRQAAIPASLTVGQLPQALPREASICLFRIAQEALRNIDRHARARRVELTLHRLDGGVQLGVRDDGVGFDPAMARGRPSLGLASMRERVALVEGEIDIESALGHGTTVVAWVPIGGGPS